MPTRRAIAATLAALAAPRPGLAQATAWPAERPIEVVVPVPPGGALDALARLLMPHVCAHLGEGAKFVVINRPGAGTQIGNEAVFNAAPDGYTLGCITAPALLIWGEQDRFVPLANGRAYAANLPKAALKVLPGVGHSAILEAPEQCMALIAPFLSTGALP